MTHLRKMMLEELERRNYAQTTCVQLPSFPFTFTALRTS
jgi:hypothetical protein